MQLKNKEKNYVISNKPLEMNAFHLHRNQFKRLQTLTNSLI